jgi:hypothetical protein
MDLLPLYKDFLGLEKSNLLAYGKIMDKFRRGLDPYLGGAVLKPV